MKLKNKIVRFDYIYACFLFHRLHKSYSYQAQSKMPTSFFLFSVQEFFFAFDAELHFLLSYEKAMTETTEVTEICKVENY